jgi:hypothetical protein
MKVETTKLVVGPGDGRNGMLARLAFHQFNEDSESMRTIAMESKQDRSVMEIIVLLGVISLPGVFIAVSFLFINGRMLVRSCTGYLLHAGVQLRWKWCSCHSVGVQVLLGCGSSIGGIASYDVGRGRNGLRGSQGAQTVLRQILANQL